tara:strand:+ start:1105 stop:1476 length:372 start_codon:yes stop_codon:yes gene_type:complete
MNNLNEIPQTEIQFFKEKVTRWLLVDKQIDDLQTQIKDLKKVRDKELQPQLTNFMVSNNVSDLNTENGKLRCHERKTKKGLNKHNIRDNLSQFLAEQDKLDEAVTKIMNEREVIVKHVIKKVK